MLATGSVMGRSASSGCTYVRNVDGIVCISPRDGVPRTALLSQVLIACGLPPDSARMIFLTPGASRCGMPITCSASAIQPSSPPARITRLDSGLLGVHGGELLGEPARLLHRRHPLLGGVVAVEAVRDGQHRGRCGQRPDPLRGLQHAGARREHRVRRRVGHVRDGRGRVRGGRGAGQEGRGRARGDRTERGGRGDDLNAALAVRRGPVRGAIADHGGRMRTATTRGAVTSHETCPSGAGSDPATGTPGGEGPGSRWGVRLRCVRDRVVTLGTGL